MSGVIVLLAGVAAAMPLTSPVDASGTPRLDGLRATGAGGTVAQIHVGAAGLLGRPTQGIAGFGALYAPTGYLDVGFGLMDVRGGGLEPLVRPGAVLLRARTVPDADHAWFGGSLSIAAPVASVPGDAVAAAELRVGVAPSIGRFRMLANATGSLAVDGFADAWAGLGADVSLPLGTRLAVDGGMDVRLGWAAGACFAFPVAAGVHVRTDASVSEAQGVTLRVDLGVRTGVDGAGQRLRQDRDGDGVVNDIDRCPREYGERADGCPTDTLTSAEGCQCPLDTMSLARVAELAVWLSQVEGGSVFVVGVRVKATGDPWVDYEATVRAADGTRAGLLDAGADPAAFKVVGLQSTVGETQPFFSAERMSHREAIRYIQTFAVRPPVPEEEAP